MGGIFSRIFRSKGENTAKEIRDQNPCEDYQFTYTGCEITIQGKLLLVLDTINSTLQTYFSCFCELVISRLNNTNVTSEVLFGKNTTCSIPKTPINVDQNLLRNKLTNLSSEFRANDNEAGMAIILSDQVLTSENFTDKLNDTEPYLFIVNVGQNESESRSCFRQERFISEMVKLEEIGQEMESFGCYGEGYKQRYCPVQNDTTLVPRLTPTDSSEVIGIPLVVLGIAGALVLAVLVIVYLVFRRKYRKQRKYKRNTQIELSAIGNEFDGNSSPQKSELHVSSKNTDVYNVLWEKEIRETDRKNEDNYHNIDVCFVKGNINPSSYDVVGGIRENPDVVFKLLDQNIHSVCGFDGNTSPQKSELHVSSKNTDVYNVLWEKEIRETDKKNEDNYHHIDVRFVKGNINPSSYDVVGGIRENPDVVFKPPD